MDVMSWCNVEGKVDAIWMQWLDPLEGVIDNLPLTKMTLSQKIIYYFPSVRQKVGDCCSGAFSPPAITLPLVPRQKQTNARVKSCALLPQCR
jgi:hypothetical protein